MWRAVYTHATKSDVEVTTETTTQPARRRMFLVGGGPTLLTRTHVERINTTNEKESTAVATKTARKRPKKKRTREPDDIEAELDDLDVDDLDLDDLDVDDLDIEDEADLDLDDEDEEEDDEEEYEDEDEDEEEIEDEADDDLDLDDLDEDEEEEPAPPPRKARTSAKKSARKAPVKETPQDKPLTDAQQRMLKSAKKLKNGAKVENVGQRRTAEALQARGLVKKLVTDSRGVDRAIITKAGEKVAAGAPAPSPSPARKSAAKKSSERKTRGNGRVPKGMVGVAQIAKAAGDVHEETVRRVLRLNDDQFPKDEELGRYVFDKATAKRVVAEVKAYVKYTGGKRGRPAGAYTELPEGKVGVNDIAEMADVHPNTVYKFLGKHEDRFAKFKDEDMGVYLFTEKQAEKIADKLAG